MSILSALRLSKAPARGFFAMGFLWGAFAATAPLLKAQVGASDHAFGMLLLGTAVGLGSTIWLAPRFDQSLRAWALPGATVMLALGFLLPGHVVTPVALFLVMALLGMCSGLMDVVMNARVSELEMLHERALMNANHGVFSVGYATSAILAGIARESGLQVTGIFTCTSMLVLLLALGMRSAPAPATPQTDTAPVRLSPVLIGLTGLVVLVAFTAEAAVEAWSALHLERTLGGRAVEGAIGPALLGVTMAIGRFFGQSITDRVSPYVMIDIAGAVTIAGALLAALAPSTYVAYLGFGLLGLGVSVIGPLGIATAGRLSSPEKRTSAIARVAVIGFLGFFIAPAIMGGIAALYGLRMAFISVAILLCALPLLTFGLRRLEASP